MPEAVIAEIGSRPRIVRTKTLPAIANVITTRHGFHRYRAVVDIALVIVSRVVVTRTAVVTVVRRKGAADHGTGHRAGEEASAAVMVMTVAAAIS